MASMPLVSSLEQKSKNDSFENKSLPQYLGSFICNLLGDKAYLYLKEGQLEARIYDRKGEVTILSSSQIQGGEEGNMPLEQLVRLVKTIAAPFLFASYQNNTLCIFARNFKEIQKNQFLKPRIKLPSSFFESVKREDVLNTLQKKLQQNHVLVLLKDSKIPLKRVGKTEIAQQYLKEYSQNYKFTFWIQAFDLWHFKKDIENIAHQIQIQPENFPQFLETTSDYLLIFDGVEDPQLIENYLPKNSLGHILITSRSPFWSIHPLQVGLLTKEEGVVFLLKHTKGEEEEAKQVAQTLGYVPSSLYRAVETITVEDLTLASYLTHCQTLLEEHAQVAAKASNLPVRNKDFVGREADLVALEESFSANKPLVLAANAGLGGIGKTQIALQYAYRTFLDYNFIWWINAGNLDLSYDALARKLGIQLTDEEKREEHATIKKVNLYLEKNPGWLLIFDNVEDEASVKGLFPESGGHVLITTRNPYWDQAQVEVFEIEVFKREESIELILKVTGLFTQQEAADRLAQQLQDLPLAIAQAAAYIRETGISIEEYIEDFQNWHKALSAREGPTNNYEFTFSVTWNISMKKIQEREDGTTPQPVALPLMQLCSFLAPHDIPRDSLLLEWLKIEYKEKDQDLKACLADLNRTLKLLEKFSMIKLGEGKISVHRLVQAVERDHLSEEIRKKYLQRILQLSEQIFKGLNPEYPEVRRELDPLIFHFRSASDYLKKEKLSNDGFFKFLQMRRKIWKYEYYEGNYLNSKNLALQIMDHCNDLLKESVERANILRELGMSLWALGQYEEALKFYKEAVQHRQMILGEKNNDVALDHRMIGSALHGLGKYEEALEVNLKALGIIQSINVDDTPLYLQDIGSCLLYLDRYEEALDYYSNSLKILQQNQKPNYADIGMNYFLMAAVYSSMDNYEQALLSTNKALEIQLKVLGDTHPETATSYNMAGYCLLKLGKIDESYINLMKALSIRLEKLGEEHLYTSLTYKNLGLNHIEKAEYTKAIEYYQKALKTQIKIAGEESFQVAETYRGIGKCYFQLKKYKNAVEFLTKALDINKKKLPKDHPDTLRNQEELNKCLTQMA